MIVSLLRRDEIWLAEKEGRGFTHSYSLSDFKARQHKVGEHQKIAPGDSHIRV